MTKIFFIGHIITKITPIVIGVIKNSIFIAIAYSRRSRYSCQPEEMSALKVLLALIRRLSFS